MTQSIRNRRGSALILAIMLLGICFSLGLAFVVSMEKEVDSANFALRESRAGAIAEGGVNAALGALAQSMRDKQAPANLNAPQVIQFPAYELQNSGGTIALQVNEDRVSQASVTVSDEGGRINLNCAPAPVLQAILGINAAAAQKIYSDIHRTTGAQWLSSVDDLVARGLLPESQMAAVNRDWVTAVSVPDPNQPAGSLNVNTAAPEVLAAILGVDMPTARKVAEKRPFASVEAFRDAAGKAPSTYNYKAAQNAAADSLPADLSVESRCFRIVSEGDYASSAKSGGTGRGKASVEAIVLFRPDGGYDIVEWNTAG